MIQKQNQNNNQKLVVVKTVQYPFPKTLEERFAAILSCVNTEWKSIVLAGVLDVRVPKGRGMMKSDFEALVGEVYTPEARAFVNYADCTFVPMGLVARKIMARVGGISTISRWCLTDAGEKYGAPIAAFSLYWAIRHGRSLYEILGPTESPGSSRSPYNRAMLLLGLVERSDTLTRIVDLESFLNLGTAGVREHLRALKRIGFLDYDSVSSEESGWAKYAWISSKDPEDAKNKQIGPRVKLAKKVIDLLSKSGRAMDRNEIAAAVSYKYPEMISIVLSDLKEQGYVECKWQGGVKQSDVKITDIGREFVETYIKPVRDALADGPSLSNMLALRSSASEVARDAARLYYPHSEAYKQRPAKERIVELLKFVADHENSTGIGPRCIEIRRSMAQKGANACKYIRQCLAEGLLNRRKSGRAVRYTLTSKGKVII